MESDVTFGELPFGILRDVAVVFADFPTRAVVKNKNVNYEWFAINIYCYG
jgi:hypothetical protein